MFSQLAIASNANIHFIMQENPQFMVLLAFGVVLAAMVAIFGRKGKSKGDSRKEEEKDEQSQPETTAKNETPVVKKLSVKFTFQGGQAFDPSSGTPAAKEEINNEPSVPPETSPKPAQLGSRNRTMYCPSCDQYHELAENKLSAGITCSICHTPLHVILSCLNCSGVLSLEVSYFVHAKNMQAQCPICSKIIPIG
ncbi:MAG: hypothetical protein RBG13Loki_3568 [Promethearchaeota archaeon CR_4]|nr:MAG: hypothetical protein RBG13Loki_3568 [Candidatus Lokiarchaeota archaeon CR_4]